ncbi:MAG: SNF2-related protein, partial [Proteobacteria bacterium]|nr:SNF2-related protein [Pseudomonadota bacterium]
MGLGKTIQTLGLFESLRRRGELGKSLIVVPSSLIHNWLSEAKKFAPQLSVTVFDPKVLMEQRNQNLEESADQGNILLTTYGMLTEHSDRFQGSPWNVVIFDEAQNLKNIKSVRTAAARSIQACVKFALTGTPMENHYGEFYSLIDLVASGSLGTYSDFLQEYQVKLNQGARTAEMRESIEFLRLKAKPLVLRRTKDRLLLELPEKTETTLLLPFEISQKKIYRDTAISWNNRVKELISAKGEAMGQLQMLTALLRLRQVCSYPGAVPNTLYSKMPPKFESLIESLDELRERGEPAVVFTNFVTTLTALETELNNQGFFT